jgi:hypothetical protein
MSENQISSSHSDAYEWVFRSVVCEILTDVSEELRAIALMMEAVSSSETSVNFYQTTRRNIPEDSHLHSESEQSNSTGRELILYSAGT